VREADAVIWLVDGRDGLTVADETLATQLRPLCKHLYLAVNKPKAWMPILLLPNFTLWGSADPMPSRRKEAVALRL
jgi:Predicted GTPases